MARTFCSLFELSPAHIYKCKYTFAHSCSMHIYILNEYTDTNTYTLMLYAFICLFISLLSVSGSASRFAWRRTGWRHLRERRKAIERVTEMSEPVTRCQLAPTAAALSTPFDSSTCRSHTHTPSSPNSQVFCFSLDCSSNCQVYQQQGLAWHCNMYLPFARTTYMSNLISTT